MKRILLTLASVLMLAAVACAQFNSGGTQIFGGQMTSPAPSTSVQPAVLPSLFSIHVHTPASTWPTIPIGGVRLWGTSTYWNILSPSTGVSPNCTGTDGVYNWANLDNQINVADANNTNLIYTVIGVNPCWISSNQSASCAAGALGTCAPPNDVAADGTGTDNHLITFISAFMAHIQGGADPHHRIIGFECANESNGPVSNPTGPTGYWTGTIPQLARMCKDIYQTVKAADPTMIITSPAPSKGVNGPASWLPLYFADPSNPIQYADVIGYHNYNNVPSVIPKASDNLLFMSSINAALAPLALPSRPFWVTEGSWDESGVTPLTNLDQKAGYIIQDYVLLNSLGVQRFYFFAWDQNGGEGYVTSGVVQPAGIAAGQVYDWMVGAQPATIPPCVIDANSTFTCTYTRSGGYVMKIIWNQIKDPTDTCKPTGGTAGQVIVIPNGFTRYRDMYGDAHSVTPGQNLNACYDPIALETGVPPTIQISTGATLPGVTSGVAYNFTPGVSGSTTGPFRWQIRQGNSVLPAGIALNQSTGAFTGTTTALGTFPFQLSACDANGLCDALNLALIVSPNQLTLTSGAPPNGTVGTAYPTYSITAVNGVTPYNCALEAGSGPLPNGLTLSPLSCTITGNPTVANTFPNITLRLNDNGGAHVDGGPYSVTINPSLPPTLTIMSGLPPGGTVGTPYSFPFSATGGVPCTGGTYNWGLAPGSNPLPGGLSIAPTTGVMSGTPNAAATFSPTIRVTDCAPGTPAHADGGPYTILISPSSGNRDNIYTPFNTVTGLCSPAYGSTSDSFALTPTRCQNSARVNRPSPGSTVVVASGGSFQTALNALTCGQTIKLTAGATYSGTFTFPALTCDVNHWITITTTAAASLPPEGTRVTPCYNNLASLPGRPSYPCPTPVAAMPHIVEPGSTPGPIFLSTNNSNFIQFIGVDIAGTCVAPCENGPLIQGGSGVHDIVFDQILCHGQEGTFPITSTSYTDTSRCIGMGQSHNIMMVDSYAYDFYCASTIGPSCDAQVIGGGIGTLLATTWGNYKFVNNFWEAAGEEVELGGDVGPGPNPCTPSCIDDTDTDIEVRLNHMFKPLQWLPPVGTSGPSGWPIVKNHFECKNCERAFLEGNILENTWPGYSQNGIAILMTPKNQQNGAINQCPNCSVHDIIIRYNLIRTANNAFQLANGTNGNGVLAFQGYGYSVHDNIADNLMAPNLCWGTGGSFCAGFVTYQISEYVALNVTATILHNLDIKNNTTVVSGSATSQPAGLLGLSGNVSGSGFQVNNIFFNHNLGTQLTSGTINVVGGGVANCALGTAAGITTINSCWNPNQFASNIIVNSTAIWGASQCLSEATFTSVFVNYNNGLNGDYHVKPTSSCASFMSGANVDLVNAAIAGVN